MGKWTEAFRNMGSGHGLLGGEYNGQLQQLFETELYIPKHESFDIPDEEDGLAWASGLPEHKWAFEYFRRFPNYVHRFHEPGEIFDCGPWRLEQRSDIYAMLTHVTDTPVAGLRHKLFYNTCQIGDLEIVPNSGFDEIPEPHKEVTLYIQLNNALLLPHDHIESLLSICSERFDSYHERHGRMTRKQAILESMTKTIWENMRNDNLWADLNFEYSGTVNTSFEIR